MEITHLVWRACTRGPGGFSGGGIRSTLALVEYWTEEVVNINHRLKDGPSWPVHNVTRHRG